MPRGPRITKTLRVPLERPPGGYNVNLTCQMIVEVDGTVTRPHCMTDDRYRSFEWEVIKAVSSASMEPATVDGQPVRVLMNFFVAYRCAEACNALVLSNHTRHVRELGFDYSSPQPILEEGTWYRGYDEKLAWIASERRAQEVGGVKYVLSTRIDQRGRSARRTVEQQSEGVWKTV